MPVRKRQEIQEVLRARSLKARRSARDSASGRALRPAGDAGRFLSLLEPLLRPVPKPAKPAVVLTDTVDADDAR